MRDAKLGIPWTDEMREKMEGKTISLETIAKIVAKTTGQKRSEETKIKMNLQDLKESPIINPIIYLVLTKISILI